MQRELEQAKTDEAAIEEQNTSKETGLSNTKNVLDGINDTHEYQMMVQRQYEHMIQRMNQDLIAIQIRFNETQDSYKNKHQVYTEEAERHRQAKQQRLQA